VALFGQNEYVYHNHYYHHYPVLEEKVEEVFRELESIQGTLDQVLERLEAMSDLSEETKAVVEQVNERTNGIAEAVGTTVTLIGDLRNQIDQLDDGATPQELQTMKNTLETAAGNLQTQMERLQAVGQNPEQPVPPEG